MISNLTDPVPPELITVNFITKYLLLNFQSLAKRMRNAAALSAINGSIKSRRGLFNTQEPAVNTGFTLSYRRSRGKGPGLGDFPTKRVNASLSLRQSWSFFCSAQTPYKRLASCPSSYSTSGLSPFVLESNTASSSSHQCGRRTRAVPLKRSLIASDSRHRK